MRPVPPLALCLAALALAGCATPLPPPATVPRVDLGRYAGLWYEIESFPSVFQSGCECTTAEYRPLSDGTVEVVNSCYRGGRLRTIRGTARAMPGSGEARLKVRFGMPLQGDYWILDLDPDYRWAAVGTPDRNFLWILARQPFLDPVELGRIRARLAAQGYDVSRLRSTRQSCQ